VGLLHWPQRETHAAFLQLGTLLSWHQRAHGLRNEVRRAEEMACHAV
jgi:hypothetical protein